jgi:hypothetical protein
MWLWWYDHGGAVQSYGLDIVADFPTFVVLLMILKHFSAESWGTNPGFKVVKDVEDDEGAEMLTVSLKGKDPVNDHITIDFPRTRLRHALFRRGTIVVDVTRIASTPTLLDQAQTTGSARTVAKIYRSEEGRHSEVELLNWVYSHLKDEDTEYCNAVQGHIPIVIASGHWPDKYASTMKDLLDVDGEIKKLSRGLHVVVFVKLEPITKLTGARFLKVFRDCVICKYGAVV